MNSRDPLLNYLDRIEEKCKDRDPSLSDIVQVFGSDGHYVFILFLTIPFLQPIPLFGLSTPFGLLIGLIASLAYLKKLPWLPKRWAQKSLSSKTVSLIAEGSERIFEKIGFLLKPRWTTSLRGPFRTLNVSIFILNSILLAMPLPIPFSNAFPAWAILMQTLAHLEDDGALVWLSYIQTIATCVFFVFAFKGTEQIIIYLKSLI